MRVVFAALLATTVLYWVAMRPTGTPSAIQLAGASTNSSTALRRNLSAATVGAGLGGFAALLRHTLAMVERLQEQATLTAAKEGSPEAHVERPDMRLYRVHDVDPKAVCNDGSPGAYYHRSAAPGFEGKWVIQVMGGGWCLSGPDCIERLNTSFPLMSTADLPPSVTEGEAVDGLPVLFGGVQSVNATQNPAFASYNHAFVWYCSSDCHLGDREVRYDDGSTLQFRGRRVHDAVIDSLLAHRGLAEATDVLYSGVSAGGVAVMNGAGRLLRRLKPRLPRLQRFKALVDAAVFLDLPQYEQPEPRAYPFGIVAQVMADSYGAEWDAECVAAQRGLQDGVAWRCFHAEHWPSAPSAVPFMFTQQLYDIFQIAALNVVPDSQEDFRSRLSAVLRSQPAGGAAFASSCMLHDTVGNSLASVMAIDGRSEMEAISDWFFNDRQAVVIDPQEGLCALMMSLLESMASARDANQSGA